MRPRWPRPTPTTRPPRPQSTSRSRRSRSRLARPRCWTVFALTRRMQTASVCHCKPYDGEAQASVHLLRSDDYLWLCFSGLKPGAENPGSFVGLRADIDNSRPETAQAAEAGFFVGEDGDVFTR